MLTKSSVLVCLMAALAGMPASSTAQTRSLFSNLANPSIGMNALFLGQAAPDLSEPYGPHFQEAELSAISVVDPYWTLNANIVFAPEEVGAEEVWASTARIPSLQLKAGKLRATFGKHGLLHVHAFPFVQAPVIMANTIGEEGFKDAGLEAAWLTPLPWFSELTGGIYEALPADSDHALDFGSTEHGNMPYLGHWKNLFDLGSETTMEIGGSLLQGRGSDGYRHAAHGADLTFRNVPLRRSNQRGWILQGEYLERASYPDGIYHKEAHGFYGSLQYRLSQVWWAGIRGEQAKYSFTDVLVDGEGNPIPGKVSRGSANIAWVPSEFSFIRLEYSYARAEDALGLGQKPIDRRIMLQASYTIGYHPAHAY
jgi:hypothetical protein